MKFESIDKTVHREKLVGQVDSVTAEDSPNDNDIDRLDGKYFTHTKKKHQKKICKGCLNIRVNGDHYPQYNPTSTAPQDPEERKYAILQKIFLTGIIL